jgi:hypothetical protein
MEAMNPVDDYVAALIETGTIRDYQLQWLRDALTHERVAMLGARQIGKGWTVGLMALVLATGYRLPDGTQVPGHDVMILSKDQRTSKNMIGVINKHVDAVERLYGAIRHGVLGGVSEVVLASGCRILSLPGTPRSVQGFSGSVIIDELAASAHDPEELFAQGLSVSSSKDHFRFIVVTNAGSVGSFCHRFFHGDGEWAVRRDQFRVSSTTIYDAYHGDLPARFVGLRKSISPQMWSRFFENEFVASGSSVLDARASVLTIDSAPKIGTVWMAVDPGFGNNPTGIIVASAHPERGYAVVQHSSWFWDAGIVAIVDRIKAIMKHYRPIRVFIDRGFAGLALEPYFSGNAMVEFVSVNRYNKAADLQGVFDLAQSGRLRVLSSQAMGGKPDVLYRDLDQLILTDTGDLDLGREIVSQHDTLVPAMAGREIHADTVAALSYLSSSLNGQLARKVHGVQTVKVGRA